MIRPIIRRRGPCYNHAAMPLGPFPAAAASLAAVLEALAWPGEAGLQLASAAGTAARHHPDLDPDRPALLLDAAGRLAALARLLARQYPPEHPLTLVTLPSGAPPRLQALPLAALAAAEPGASTATLWLAVPPREQPGSMQSLAELIAHLRAPEGCPWDREQTHASLRPFLLEEAHESLEALDRGDPAALREELGDLLLQIVLHAEIATESADFNLAELIGGLSEKLIRRHPHVFGAAQAETADAVRASWEALKRRERAEGGRPEDPFAGIPAALPALARAQALQERRSRLAGPGSGRDDSDPALQPEATPPPEAAPADAAERADRIGAELWALVARARAWGVDAETALREQAAARARAWVAELAPDPDPDASARPSRVAPVAGPTTPVPSSPTPSTPVPSSPAPEEEP